MKTTLRKIFWFILKFFEEGNDPFEYKPVNRKILVAVGILFTFLSIISLYFGYGTAGYGYLIPVLVFFVVGFISFIVGFLGSDRAVSKIWGNR